MRIVIACRAMDQMAGGVERQAIALANEMAERGYEVNLLTFDLEGAQAFYVINPRVNWHPLSIGNPKERASLAVRLKRMAKTREFMDDFKPDVILAFQQGMFLTLRLYTLGMGIPVIAAERESPYRYDFTKEGKRRDFIFQTFRLAPHITVQCESYIKAYPEYLQNKITVIPNAIKPAEKTKSFDKGETVKKLLCVGRLTYQKNQKVLIDAFALIAPEFPDWKLVFAGDGEDLSTLKDKVKNLNLEDRVEFLGAVKNISDIYLGSDVLCIPSRWEGFPNVLGEALAHGLPAVGYQGCGGVRDLIIDGKNGFLADGTDDAKTLTEALRVMMQDENQRQDMGRAAVESMKPYVPNRVYDQWEDFLKQVAKV